MNPTTTPTRRRTTNAAPTPTLRPADTGDWRDDGECRAHDPNLWFPVGDNQHSRAQADEAKAICGRCAVRSLCLSWALETKQDHGVLGGMTEKERLALHKRRSGTTFGRNRNVAEHIYSSRLEEFLTLRAQGLGGVELAAALSTNVQTVNRVNDMIAAAARAAAEEVAA
ncbi:WhiB family transcriptional regulator [Streptomyces rochei]|uniref:WhiB family transcriptional regulator n=1 Tax=Streptomyces rochei TaxID=1928 RepID=UPI00368136F4